MVFAILIMVAISSYAVMITWENIKKAKDRDRWRRKAEWLAKVLWNNYGYQSLTATTLTRGKKPPFPPYIEFTPEQWLEQAADKATGGDV